MQSVNERAGEIDHTMGQDGERPEIPTEQTMGAAEVLTWIAFRKAIPLETWAKEVYKFSHPWPLDVQTFYNENTPELIVFTQKPTQNRTCPYYRNGNLERISECVLTMNMKLPN